MNSPLLPRRRFLGALSLALAAGASTRLAAAAPRPRVGCQANGFPLKPGDFPALLAALRQMKSLDYAGFECNVRFVEGEFGRVAEARRQIEDTGVQFVGIHASMTQAKPEVLSRWAEKLAALGGSYVVMSGAGLAANGVFAPAALQQKAAALDELGRRCRAGGVRLAYHNHNPEFANRHAEAHGLAAHTDPQHVHFLLDAGHAKLGGGDPAAFLTKHADRIVGCHLKTYRELVQVPLGEGDWDFRDLAAAIQTTRWDGWLITEEGGGSRPGNTAALGPDRAYIRRIFQV